MMPKIKQLLIAAWLLQPHSSLIAAKGEEAEKVGNFLLATSQQPGPLFGFGQNIVDAHDLQIFFNYFHVGSKNCTINQALSNILFGIRDDLSLFITIPLNQATNNNQNHTGGMNGITIQLEHAFFNKQRDTSITQSTIVANMSIPTKSCADTGFGAPSYFLGVTLSHTAQWWYGWIQGGANLATKQNNTILGNQFLYQSGIERCFATPSNWIIAGTLELFGLYQQKNSIKGVKNNNSGGNTVWLGPSLWASSEKVILEAGLAVPVVEQLYGKQRKNNYSLSINFGYKFN